VIFEQRLAYDDLDQITKAWSTANGAVSSELYGYDQLGRLASTHPTDTRLNPAEEVFQYDLAGNRTYVFDDANGIAQTYAHAPTTNRLTRVIQSEAGNPLYRDHTLAYQSDGALATRTRSDAQGAQMVQRNESFAYDAVGLIERYRVQRDVGGMQGVCAPDASSQPISEWRYRFGPLQEREQKRQYLSDVPTGGLAWTYTLLGADAKQLASYNGIQGAFCGQPPTTVWLWPVEYNSYGPAHTHVIMRPGGTSEYVLHDHLGSARITLDNAARVIESQSYTAYGDHRTHDGEAARTSYIGRETDKESDLGFNGVRLYDPTYGRFLSVDPLWGKYLPLQSYQYAANNPVMMLDDGGKEIVGSREEDREYLKSSMCSHFGVDVSFTDLGAMMISADELAEASSRIDPMSYGQLLGINEMANDKTKVLNVVALPGEEYRKDRLKLPSTDKDGKVIGTVSNEYVTGKDMSEKFVSNSDAPNNSFVLIRPAIAEKETFNAVGGGQTKPCGTCVLMHALLDHAMPWFKYGVSATRKEGVTSHNVGLLTKAKSQARDGSDHNDQGEKSR
jgi:RHS repeat-associated protein